MSTTATLFHPDFLEHDTGYGHPERPERLLAVMEALDASPRKATLLPLEPRPATVEELALVHDPYYIAYVEKVAGRGGGSLAYDTPLGARSYDVARLSAGAVLRGVDAVIAGEADNAFAVCRPPGHHATPTRGMGFCLFNNVAVGARYAQQAHGLSRILIVDWDVHHGNGTQDAFYDDPTVFFFSIHQSPLYPWTGAADEQGRGPGLGATLNVPMRARSTDADYVRMFEERLLPAARQFRPELVFVSAGFDAHEEDPLATMRLTSRGFAALTDIVRGLAEEFCGGRLVSALEGGYHLGGLASSVAAHVERLG
jgi:acetoin utilization deacetylase AcuC-like enzyme